MLRPDPEAPQEKGSDRETGAFTMALISESLADRQLDTAACSICRGSFEGYGNNSQPVNDGRCCDICNRAVVIPVRLAQMKDKAAWPSTSSTRTVSGRGLPHTKLDKRARPHL